MTVGLGIVVIGRNEGERLKTCIRSLPAGVPCVYVDSGSSDGSPDWARSEGCEVVELTTDRPFSAARARNEGFERLLENWPEMTLVQFIDGDCELLQGWLPEVIEAFDAEDSLAAYAGLVRERHPEASWYNEMCSYEWQVPAGKAEAVGGIAAYRTRTFQQLGGFDPLMMAGEEPELCFRLRRAGFVVRRSTSPMVTHDAAIYTFGAWWKRAVRSGYASTLGMLKHGKRGYRVREVTRAILWGGIIPLLIVGLPWFGVGWLSLVLMAFMALKWFRLRRQYGPSRSKPGRYAWSVMLTNVAEVRGIVRAFLETAKGERRIVEYKT